MKRVLFCIFILSAACSKSDSKSGVTTPPGDTGAAADNEATEEAATEEAATEGVGTGESEAATEGEGAGEGEAVADSSTPAAPKDASKPNPSVYPNLKVLPKTWSTKQVKTYMKQMTSGLGVLCTHCHEKGNFASDAMPTKLAARKMLSMTRMLDKKHFGGKGKVTCITCHKGKIEP